MTKWDRFRSSLNRVHSDFEFPTATFTNNVGGYDPSTGEITQDYSQDVGSFEVEFVPPSMDATVDTEGTHLNFDTSIRAPEAVLGQPYNEGTYGNGVYPGLIVYGEDAKRPTRVDIEGTTYEVQGARPEHGSGMTLLRLTEL